MRLALSQFVARHLILQDVRKLQIIVTYCLTPKHDHGVRVDHVEAHQPYLLLCHYVNDLPVASLGVQLLNRGAVREGLIAHCVDVAFGEGAAIGSTDGLAKLR